MDNIVGAKRPRKQFTRQEPNPEIELAKKSGKLTRQDVTCPICWSILYEPTTLPCKHSLCIECFKRHVEEASICCPCCRRRLSVWSRGVSKSKKLLDEPLWNRIQAEFPRLVSARLNDLDSQDVLEGELPPLSEDHEEGSEHENAYPVRIIIDGIICNEPGEVRSELLQIQVEHEKDMERERLLSEAASAELIRKIQEEEEENRRVTLNSSVEEEDFLFAKRLQNKLRREDERLSASAIPRRISTRIKRPIRRNLNGELYEVQNSSFDSSSFSTSTDSSFFEDQSPIRRSAPWAVKKRKKIPSCTVTSEQVKDNSHSLDICSTAELLVPPAPVNNISEDVEASAPVENFETPLVPNFSLAESFNEADDRKNITDITCPQENSEFGSQEASSASNISACLNENRNVFVHQKTKLRPSSPPVPPTPDKNFDSRQKEGMDIDLIFNDSFNGLSPLGKGCVEINLGEKEYEYLVLEATTLEARRQKLEQEVKDRAFAKSLNSRFRLGLSSPGRSENSYKLRCSIRKETPVVGANDVD